MHYGYFKVTSVNDVQFILLVRTFRHAEYYSL